MRHKYEKDEDERDLARVDGCATIDQQSELPRHATGLSDREYYEKRHRRDGRTISQLIREHAVAEKRIETLCLAHEKALMRAEVAEARLKELTADD